MRVGVMVTGALWGLLAGPAAVAQGSGAAQPLAAAPADVRFMQGMIAHHGQALEMVALIPARSTRPDLALLGERIAVSQRDEIALMRRWLREHGAPQPDSAMAGMDHAGHAGHAAMPGMLTPAEMARLAETSGPAFERLFLESMIRHHQGALVMVGELFGSRGGGQDPEVFRFASDVDTDQRAEIARMQALLGAMAPEHRP